jgi:hypothetical protein
MCLFLLKPFQYIFQISTDSKQSRNKRADLSFYNMLFYDKLKCHGLIIQKSFCVKYVVVLMY